MRIQNPLQRALTSRNYRRSGVFAAATAILCILAGATPASANGPSGKPVTEGIGATLDCDGTSNLQGAEVRTYVEAYTPNHGKILRGAMFWVTYQIHADSHVVQWPLSANRGVRDTEGTLFTWNGTSSWTAPPLTFRAPTGTSIAGPPQFYTPGPGEVATPHVLPNDLHNYGDGRAAYPGKQTTRASVIGGSATELWMNVQADSFPTGNYSDGFYFEIRVPVRVNNAPGTITVLPLTTFTGLDGTSSAWEPAGQYTYSSYACTPYQWGRQAFITNLGFTVAW